MGSSTHSEVRHSNVDGCSHITCHAWNLAQLEPNVESAGPERRETQLV